MTDFMCPYCASENWNFDKIEKEYLPQNKKVVGFRLWECVCFECKKKFYFQERFRFVGSDIFSDDDQ